MTNIESLIFRSLLAYPKECGLFFQTIKKEYLSSKEAQDVYTILWECFINQQPIQLEYIATKIHEKTFLQILGVTPTKHVQSYYKILLDDYNIRNRQALIKKLQEVQYDKKVDLQAIFSEYAPKTATTYMTKTQRREYIKQNNITFEKYELGVNFLDITLHGGIELHKLVLISGEYEAGKTSLCLQIMRNLAINHKCAYMCFEFPANKYVIDDDKIVDILLQNGELTSKQKDAIDNNIYIIDEGLNVDDVVANILFLASMGVKFFVIDSQMRLNVEQARNTEEEESRKFEALTNLCNKYPITIFLIVQTSKNDTKSPLGSKKGGHEASIMLRIEHNKATDHNSAFDENSRTVIIQKNKQTGLHAKYNVRFDTKTQTFHCEDIIQKEYNNDVVQTTKTKLLEQIDLHDIDFDMFPNL